MNMLKAMVMTGISSLTLCAVAGAQDWREPSEFQLASTEFTNGGTLPISAIYNGQVVINGASTNVCSINGAAGGDLSPELHWSHAPWGTRSFVVMTYDETAAVVHWGMYNIAGDRTNLPQNAGFAATPAAPNPYGLMVTNTFNDQSYDGPCPPAGYAPDAHRYVFTIYALDKDLNVSVPAVYFPPSGLTLYRDLLKAAQEGHVLGSASLLSFYSATPAAAAAN